MFRETKEVAYLELKKQESEDQLIAPGDLLSFSLYSRDGYELIDIIEGTGGNTAPAFGQNRLGYMVRKDGYVELPIIGEIYVEGMTRLQLEHLLEDRYSVMYNDPFILLNVTNRRVFVFMGVDGAKVVNLPDENTTLIEVIAMAGGISGGAKAHKIRVIRGDYDNPEIMKLDLSTIDGLKDADLIVQADDLIIVDPVTKIAPAILREITPVLTLVTTMLTFIVLIRNN